MELRTISASGFKVYDKCPSRYEAEYAKGIRDSSAPGTPAILGTTVHQALEEYVQDVYVDQNNVPDLQRLLDYFEVAHASSGLGRGEFEDGVAMLTTWFTRTDLSNVKVISTELKSTIEVPTNDGPRKFNYIWDRCDEYTEGGLRIIRVVDYKTFRVNRGIEDIYEDRQIRMYAVAAMIQFKDNPPDRVEVQMDLLRHGNVTVDFTVEECRQFYIDIVETANEILADEAPVERINAECVFCVKKATCTKIRENSFVGGVAAIMDDPEALLEAKVELSNQKKATTAAEKEIDEALRGYMDANDLSEITGSTYKASTRTNRRRKIDPAKLARVIGDNLFRKVAKVTLGELDKLEKNGELTDEQIQQISGQTEYTSSPSTITTGKA